MKKLAITLSMLVLSAGMIFAQAPSKATVAKKTAAPGNAVADELKQMENDWVAAEKAKDAARLGMILADSWVGLGWDGQRSDKAKALADLKAPGNSLDSIEMGPMTVRVFGTTAIVTGSNTETSKESGRDTSGKYVWTDVFVKQNGLWKAVASQSAKIP